MAETASESLFVARPSDVATLRGHFDAANSGSGRTVVLRGPIGGGKRALMGEFLRSLGATDALIWRTNLVEEEDGLRTLLRLYANLYAPLYRDPLLRGRVELMLNAQLPKKPKRTQLWYQAFIEALRKGGPKEGETEFQVTLPKDNPVLGLVEIVRGISSKMTVVMEVQNLHASQSLAVHAAIEAIAHTASEGQLLQVLAIEPDDHNARAWLPVPMLDMLERRKDSLHFFEPAPWGAEEVGAYLASKNLNSNAAEIARISGGRPGFVAELIDILNDSGRLDADLAGASFYSLMPKEVDEEELDDDSTSGAKEGENKRRKAGAADLDDVAYRAALLGRAFPSNLVADVGGYERDSIDDLLDATGELFEEMQFSKPLGTWIYQFKRAAWREGALEKGRSAEDQGHTVARQIALFLERFLVPRGYEFVVKAARTWAEAGELNRAALMRSNALSSDRPELWAMSHDLIRAYDSIPWPDPMRRTVFMNLMERMALSGDVNQAESLYNEIMAWADKHQDQALRAWLLFTGSRLDFRRQDYYRSRDRAKEAAALYETLGDKIKPAEIRNHMAMIELSDGNPTAARQLVDEALRAGMVDTNEGKRVLPSIAANAEYVRGLLEKRERKFRDAAEHFRLSNEIAGNTGQSALALESGLNFGECLLAGGDTEKAADVLQRVLSIAQALQNPVRQRGATALLAQANASLKNYEAALNWAKSTLELSKSLGYKSLLSVDTFNVGLFTLLLGRPNEALALFKEARKDANLQQDVVFSKELLFNLGVAAARVGERGLAKEAFNAAVPFARQAKDQGKVFASYQNLGNILAAEGNKASARKALEEALKVAEAAGMKDERRAVRKQLDEV